MISTLALVTCLTGGLQAQSSFYCPKTYSTVTLGMSEAAVMQACGTPAQKEESNRPITEKIPVTQMFYNNAGAPKAFYGVWSLPVGVNDGANLEVDIIDNKVASIRLNGSSSNAFSLCGGQSVNVGDPMGKVLSACGTPSVTNNTYLNQPVQSKSKPQVWTYISDPYAKTTTRLTFVDGQLKSISP